MSENILEKRVRIIADTSPDNPRDWDNLGRMVCWHNRYVLGDEQPSDIHQWLIGLAIEACPRLEEIIEYWDNEGFNWLYDKYEDDLETTLKVIGKHIDSLVEAVIAEHFVMLPLYLYDHSGITMNTTGFSCPWDSGQVGYIYCSLTKAMEDFNATNWNDLVNETTTLREMTERNLRTEIDTYDQYIRGDIWGFVVEEQVETDEWESVDCCFGFYGSDPEKNGMSDYLSPEMLALAKQN